MRLVRLLGGGFLLAALAALIFDIQRAPDLSKGVAFSNFAGLWADLRWPAFITLAALGAAVYVLGSLAVRAHVALRRRTRADAAGEAPGREPGIAPAARGSGSELAAVIGTCRGAFIGVGALSCMSSILMLTGSLFMLEVYDRVLPSRSLQTLVGLAVLAA